MKKLIRNFIEWLEDVKGILIVIGVILSVIICMIIVWNTTAYRDVKFLEVEAPGFIVERGFGIISYDGYAGSMYHGGFVWYKVRDKNDYLYEMAIGEWRGELMLYNTKCLNAVTNN